MQLDSATLIRDAGLRVTKQRMAVIGALHGVPHASAQMVLELVREQVGTVSTQAVYDVLNMLTEHEVLRRIQPAGSAARYELRVGDNHHHLVCRGCGAVVDVPCESGSAPCLHPDELAERAPGFVVDEAEVTFWGSCRTCTSAHEDHNNLEE